MRQPTLDEPPRISWGRKGEQPVRVWGDYNWLIVDSNRYMVVER